VDGDCGDTGDVGLSTDCWRLGRRTALRPESQVTSAGRAPPQRQSPGVRNRWGSAHVSCRYPLTGQRYSYL
jgi:hypothetical protein